MRKYIFPGGVIPSLREIVSLSADYKFYTTDIESLRTHYMKTLKIIWIQLEKCLMKDLLECGLCIYILVQLALTLVS